METENLTEEKLSGRLWFRALVLVGLWTLPGILVGSQLFFHDRVQGLNVYPHLWPRYVIWQLVGWYFWIPVTPFILLLGRRVPVGLGRNWAGILVHVVAASLLWSRRRPSGFALAGVVRHGAAPTLAIPLLLLGAALTGDALWMQLVPTLVYLTLADLFRASLRDGSSMIEMGGKYLVPELPDFVRPYCRKVTAFWAAFFAASAVVIALFAVARETQWWAFFTGQLIYMLMLVISALEFFARKTWFRYYPHMGPFDRLWSKLFPAQNTEQGRRSEAYIRLHKPERRSA